MADIINFSTKEATVRSILADALNNADEYSQVIIITTTTDNRVGIGHSDGYVAEKAGLCLFAAHCFTQDMYEE